MMKASIALAMGMFGLALAGCSSTPPLQASSRAGMRFIEDPGATWNCWLSCPVIVVKVRPNNDPNVETGGGPGFCQPGVVEGTYVVHTVVPYKREITWELDPAARADFEFARPDGVTIVRNTDLHGQPAFTTPRPGGNSYTYKSTSNNRRTLPPDPTSSPGFELKLVRKSNGLACGKADPPIVNQP